jgi:apolipoprotein D and lipocalin family protein
VNAKRRSLFAAIAALFASCASNPPLPTVARVELPRFMGDWYVVAHIPAPGETKAHNGVESYALQPDGGIATTYAFRDGGFDADVQVMRPNAVVWDEATNATWGMQFFWPLRFEYLVTWLDADYQSVIIARSRRDYAWIMARRPDMPTEQLTKLVEELGKQGYDTKKVRIVPQRWPDPGHPVQWRGAATAPTASAPSTTR